MKSLFAVLLLAMQTAPAFGAEVSLVELRQRIVDKVVAGLKENGSVALLDRIVDGWSEDQLHQATAWERAIVTNRDDVTALDKTLLEPNELALRSSTIAKLALKFHGIRNAAASLKDAFGALKGDDYTVRKTQGYRSDSFLQSIFLSDRRGVNHFILGILADGTFSLRSANEPGSNEAGRNGPATGDAFEG